MKNRNPKKQEKYFKIRDLEKEESIIKVVCQKLGVSKVKLLSSSRKDYLVVPRHMIAKLLRSKLGYHDLLIGLVLNRDRTSIIHARRNATDMYNMYPKYRNMYDHICEVLEDTISPEEEHEMMLFYQRNCTKKSGYDYTFTV